MARKHSVDEVLEALKKKKDCKVDSQEKIISVLQNKVHGKTNDLGNKSWGKIDYLTKYCGYTLLRCDKLTSDHNSKSYNHGNQRSIATAPAGQQIRSSFVKKTIAIKTA
jgi:hypothetical protein